MIDELINAKNGDIIATNKIILHYEHYIYYLINEYEINDKDGCYDLVVERILKSIHKFVIWRKYHKTFEIWIILWYYKYNEKEVWLCNNVERWAGWIIDLYVDCTTEKFGIKQKNAVRTAK